MPPFPSPPPPVSARAMDDPRPSPSAQAPLTACPPSHKTSPLSVVPTAKSTPGPKVDSSPPLVIAAHELAGASPPDKIIIIDRSVFDQILELDEDDELFSKDMVDAYFLQAEKTFSDMDAALGKKALGDLSSLGHFLKGSSAALGVSKVQSLCEDIQHYGSLREGTAVITEAEAVAKIAKAIARAREDYKEAKKWLNSFYRTYRPES
ncbi:signal transduction histidine kinase [Russula brevipes]|nr:signal transduction histidine kinase [Russula brevipes]